MTNSQSSVGDWSEGQFVFEDNGFRGTLLGWFALWGAATDVVAALLEEDGALVLLLAADICFTLWEAAGHGGISSVLILSWGWGPVSIGPWEGMGLSFVGETASGSGSSVTDTSFPFFLVASGVTISQLTELLVLRVLFLWALSLTEGIVELMVEGNRVVCWQALSLYRDDQYSGCV